MSDSSRGDEHLVEGGVACGALDERASTPRVCRGDGKTKIAEGARGCTSTTGKRDF